MAVPFSRPCYSGSGGSGRSGSNTNSASNNSSTTNNNSHRRIRHRPHRNANNVSLHNNHVVREVDNPVVRFLNGENTVSLDGLSLTSRIAFYALYEAYRLLQDLTGNPRRRPPMPRPVIRSPSQVDAPATPIPIPPPPPTIRPSSEAYTPDVELRHAQHWMTKGSSSNNNRVEPSSLLDHSFGSNDSGFEESSSMFSSAASSPCSSPVKKHPHLDLHEVSNELNWNGRRQVHVSHMREDDELSSQEFLNTFAHRRGQNEAPVNNYPDMIPHESHHHSGCKPFTITWSPFPDLVPSHGPQDDDDEMFDLEKSLDDVDGDGGDGGLVAVHDWSKLGAQLCDIAHRFETTFYEPSTDQQRAVYEAFQRIRLSCMFANGRHMENSLSGLARTICRQFLLSSIWILLRKVL